MVSNRKGTRFLEAGEVTGGGTTLTSDGQIVVPNGTVDFQIGAANSSYSLKLIGISIRIGDVSLNDNLNLAKTLACTRTLHGKDYKLIGISCINRVQMETFTSNKNDFDSITLPFLTDLSAGQFGETFPGLGYDEDVPQGHDALAGLQALGSTAAQVWFIRDYKGSNLTVDDRLRIRLIVGTPTESKMIVTAVVQTQGPIQ